MSRNVWSLTGCIGTGKSTLARIICERYGMVHIDSDAVYKKMLVSNEAARKTNTLFWQCKNIEAYDGNGVRNRKDIENWLFGHDDVRERVRRVEEHNLVMRPYVISALETEIAQVPASTGVLVEMAVMPPVIRHALDVSKEYVTTTGSAKKTLEIAVARDKHRDADITKKILDMQMHKLESAFHPGRCRILTTNSDGFLGSLQIEYQLGFYE